MRIALRVIGFGLAAILLIAAGIAGWSWWEFTRPGPLTAPRTVVIERGTGTLDLAYKLQDAGVLRNAFLFTAAARLREQQARLKAGEYAFPAGIAAIDVQDMLARGETVVRHLTIPEGLTAAEAVRRVSDAEGLTGEPATVPEGSLLPETYRYSWGDSRPELLRRMQRAMQDAVAKAWAARSPETPLRSTGELVVLASIIERETAIPEERARIAAVFVNRLRAGMKLQSDPTVAYAVTKGETRLARPLSRADLALDDPFNTYQREGLPPGPIALPGVASLMAAARPADSGDLYFVADGTGRHAFSRTLEEHNRNVARWRRAQQERGAPQPPPAPAEGNTPGAGAP